ncbi:MAG: DUF1906 domain-containing protein [Oscillospiraceae bacterium]|nr:DUF1906 domain-containing protein [Oscillospiraceae bacterium]
MIRGVDTAARITAETAKKLYAEGYRFVGRYLVPASGGTKWKALTVAESRDIRDAGLAILLIWEIEADRAKRGAEIGTQDGVKARELAKAMNVPNGTAVFFAVDYDAPIKDYEAIARYFAAAKAAVYPFSIGVYAPPSLVSRLSDIVPYRWETYAWCYGSTSPVKTAKQTDYQDGKDAKALTELVKIPVDLDEAVSLAGMWRSNVYEDGDGTIIDYSGGSVQTESDAVRWARGLGITTNSEIAEALWKYHCIYIADDAKTESGLLT